MRFLLDQIEAIGYCRRDLLAHVQDDVLAHVHLYLVMHACQ